MHIIAGAFALLLSAASAQPIFTHPGVFINASDIAILRARLAVNSEPQASALAKALASPQGSTNYKIFGPPADGRVTCGAFILFAK